MCTKSPRCIDHRVLMINASCLDLPPAVDRRPLAGIFPLASRRSDFAGAPSITSNEQKYRLRIANVARRLLRAASRRHVKLPPMRRNYDSVVLHALAHLVKREERHRRSAGIHRLLRINPVIEESLTFFSHIVVVVIWLVTAVVDPTAAKANLYVTPAGGSVLFM